MGIIVLSPCRMQRPRDKTVIIPDQNALDRIGIHEGDYCRYVMFFPELPDKIYDRNFFGSRDFRQQAGRLSRVFASTAERLGSTPELSTSEFKKLMEGEGIAVGFVPPISRFLYNGGSVHKKTTVYDCLPFTQPEIDAFYKGLAQRKDLLARIGRGK